MRTEVAVTLSRALVVLERARRELGADALGPGGFSAVDLLLDQEVCETTEQARTVLVFLDKRGW